MELETVSYFEKALWIVNRKEGGKRRLWSLFLISTVPVGEVFVESQVLAMLHLLQTFKQWEIKK